MTAIFIPACCVYHVFIIKEQTVPHPSAMTERLVYLFCFTCQNFIGSERSSLTPRSYSLGNRET